MRRLIVAVVVALACAVRTGAAQGPDGAALYKQHCKSCHGAKGIPPANMRTVFPELKTLADSGKFAAIPLDTIEAVLRKGKGHMRSFQGTLKPEEMAAVAKYVKTL
ncbi:MAG TPA: cytochrome c [Gemmatimonadales bacterium]|nr:cytochrome c [Gemmatimonadales bacterium]